MQDWPYGSVYHTTRQASGAWSAFSKVSNLTQTGRKNIGVSVAYDQQICAGNDAVVRQLRYTKDLTGATPLCWCVRASRRQALRPPAAA